MAILSYIYSLPLLIAAYSEGPQKITRKRALRSDGLKSICESFFYYVLYLHSLKLAKARAFFHQIEINTVEKN